MKLTDNEVKALNAIVKSEYQDGSDPVGHAVWTSYCNPFKVKRTFPGVIASLVTKGCVVTGGSSADANPEAGCDGTTLAITQSGYDALQAVLKPIRAIEAQMATQDSYGSLDVDLRAAIEQLQEAQQLMAKGKHVLKVAKCLSYATSYIAQGNKEIIKKLAEKGVV